MKCDRCGYDDNGTGDTAHVCVTTVELKIKGKEPLSYEEKEKMWLQRLHPNMPSQGVCYFLGIEDAEKKHGIK